MYAMQTLNMQVGNSSSGTASALLGWLQTLVYTGGAIFAALMLMLYFYQEKLLYHPSIPGAPKLTTDNPKGMKFVAFDCQPDTTRVQESG
jgi:hypothetical protein